MLHNIADLADFSSCLQVVLRLLNLNWCHWAFFVVARWSDLLVSSGAASLLLGGRLCRLSHLNLTEALWVWMPDLLFVLCCCLYLDVLDIELLVAWFLFGIYLVGFALGVAELDSLVARFWIMKKSEVLLILRLLIVQTENDSSFGLMILALAHLPNLISLLYLELGRQHIAIVNKVWSSTFWFLLELENWCHQHVLIWKLVLMWFQLSTLTHLRVQLRIIKNLTNTIQIMMMFTQSHHE